MSESHEAAHLRVEAGPDRGRTFAVGAAGARIGRSSSNDIVLTDPSLSRFHCRVLFKPDGSFWINDLGSTNDTRVNGKPVRDLQLRRGDVIEIGETRIAVIDERPAPGAAQEPGQEPGREPATPGGHYDLGLDGRSPARNPRRSRLLWTVAVIALVAVAVAALYSAFQRPEGKPVTLLPAATSEAFEVVYEKEEADTNNVFRYALTLRDGSVAVRIDDIKSGRHVTREKRLAPDVAKSFERDLSQTAFFELQDEYVGVMPDIWALRDLTLTFGPRTRRVRVLNRMEPEPFAACREKIEEFVQTELGLAALALPPQQLVELARDAHLQGRKYVDEKGVRNENLSKAVAAFAECIWYLETIEPKPEFYPDAVAGLEEAKRALQDRYDELMFRAERAINLRDWPGAAEPLRVIMEIVPDRSDDRYQKARKKLIDVERYTSR